MYDIRMKLTSTNPAKNYEPVGSVQISTDAEIASKVAKAHAAKLIWKELGVAARIALLRPIRDEFLARAEEFAVLISQETGKSLADSRGEMNRYITGELDWF